MLPFALQTLFPFAVAYAAASDLVTMTIPNWLCGLIFCGFWLLAPAMGVTLETGLWHLAVALVVLLVCFGCFAMGWMGGGDAKLASALALWFGPEDTLAFLLVTSMAGGVLTLSLIHARRFPLPRSLAQHGWLLRLHAPETGIPYGIAISAAALIVYANSSYMHALHV